MVHTVAPFACATAFATTATAAIPLAAIALAAIPLAAIALVFVKFAISCGYVIQSWHSLANLAVSLRILLAPNPNPEDDSSVSLI